MLTLWDLLKPAVNRVVELARPASPQKIAPKPIAPKRPPRSIAGRRPAPIVSAAEIAEPAVVRRPRAGASRKDSAQSRYDAVVALMLEKYSVRVRKWRTASSGIAWTLTYKDGRVVRLLESPKPKGPMSMAIFLHEIGHHAIGLGAYKPRCLEEYHAWMFSIRAMEEHGLNITESVRTRMYKSLRYAVRKARRRGLKELPPELAPYV